MLLTTHFGLFQFHFQLGTFYLKNQICRSAKDILWNNKNKYIRKFRIKKSYQISLSFYFLGFLPSAPLLLTPRSHTRWHDECLSPYLPHPRLHLCIILHCFIESIRENFSFSLDVGHRCTRGWERGAPHLPPQKTLKSLVIKT
jgi:hypothetical protein